ncbi:MAG: IgGFc-binding protein, partial [Polyangiales bacterium]
MPHSSISPKPLATSNPPTLALLTALCVSLLGCEFAPRKIELPPLPPRSQDAGPPAYTCESAGSRSCQGTVHVACERNGEFIEATAVDCAEKGQVCDVERTCVTCSAGARRCRPCTAALGDSCDPNVVEACSEDGSGYAEVETCGLEKPDVCYAGECTNACQLAETTSNYAGCLFFGADLDNAAIDDTSNASAQQYAIVVANPQHVPVEVRVEANKAPFGAPTEAELVDKKTVPPGDLEVFKLPRREVDGSSATGINDGTHSAVSSNAYRVTSDYPISAYQFNPLENVNVFSNDASLLLPVPALGTKYTVVGWPQTIGNSKDPEQDFDHTSSSEDLRAFLTVIGARDKTRLHVKYGKLVNSVVPTPQIPVTLPGEAFDLEIGPFDVVNLETQGLNSDFTGTIIEADQPVAVFVGSEASDVPRFGTYATRQCCADHLEEQLLPDSSASTRFVVGRMPARARALNNAALPGAPLGVAEMNEPEWIRIVSTFDGPTHVRTTLEAPDDDFM